MEVEKCINVKISQVTPSVLALNMEKFQVWPLCGFKNSAYALKFLTFFGTDPKSDKDLK